MSLKSLLRKASITLGGILLGCNIGCSNGSFFAVRNDIGEAKTQPRCSIALKEKEFVIPDEIFNAIIKAVDKKQDRLERPNVYGGYIANERSISQAESFYFFSQLNDGIIPRDKIFNYICLFSLRDVIIYRESEFNSAKANIIVPHERMHRELEYLKRDNKRKYDILMGTVKDLLSKFSGSEKTLEHLLPIIEENQNEFYTYLAGNMFNAKVERVLREDYPEAYDIFSELNEKCALSTH